MAKLTFREAASSGKMKELITLMAQDLVEPPNSMEDLRVSLCIASGLVNMVLIKKTKNNMDDVISYVSRRLVDADQGDWIYKSDMLNQLSNRKYFKMILLSQSGLTPEYVLGEAIDKTGFKTETSEDGKQIRLVVERKTYETDFSKEYDPDMDF